jgi:FkbM family methyltransferase
MSYSQIGQDLEVLSKYSNGFYVEIGASDGIELSNTYLLEKNGWDGICAEPIPEKFEKLVKNRNCKFSNRAVYSVSDEEVDFDICNSYSLLSGISSSIDTYKQHVDSDKTTIKIKTISLTDLLDNLNAPKFIEYLSLDTEGTEYDILRTFDFNKYKFGIIHVEHNYCEPRRTNIRNLLQKNNYTFIKENNWDDVYYSNLK